MLAFSDLTSFLSQEIKLEKQTRKDLPKVTGFTLSTDGPNVTLTKSHNDETITVKFNVNGSLDNNETVPEEPIENDKAGKEPEPSAVNLIVFIIHLQNSIYNSMKIFYYR